MQRVLHHLCFLFFITSSTSAMQHQPPKSPPRSQTGTQGQHNLEPRALFPVQQPPQQQVAQYQQQPQQLAQYPQQQQQMYLPQSPNQMYQQQPQIVSLNIHMPAIHNTVGTNFQPQTNISNEGNSTHTELNAETHAHAELTQNNPPPPEPPKYVSCFNQFAEFGQNNTYVLMSGAVLCGYVALWYCRISAHNVMRRRLSWGNWKSELKFSQLITLPQEKLCDELAFEIARRYINPSNAHDTSHLLTEFFAHIDRERATLRRFIWLSGWLQRCCVSWTFLIFGKHVRQARRHLKRINFLKNTVLSRVAQNTYLNLIPRDQSDYIDVFCSRNPFGRKTTFEPIALPVG